MMHGAQNTVYNMNQVACMVHECVIDGDKDHTVHTNKHIPVPVLVVVVDFCVGVPVVLAKVKQAASVDSPLQHEHCRAAQVHTVALKCCTVMHDGGLHCLVYFELNGPKGKHDQQQQRNLRARRLKHRCPTDHVVPFFLAASLVGHVTRDREASAIMGFAFDARHVGLRKTRPGGKHKQGRADGREAQQHGWNSLGLVAYVVRTELLGV